MCVCVFHPHSLVFLLGFAEQLQDVDGPWFCDTIGPPWLCPLWWLSLSMVCFLFHNPGGELKHSTETTHITVICFIKYFSNTPHDNSSAASKANCKGAKNHRRANSEVLYQLIQTQIQYTLVMTAFMQYGCLELCQMLLTSSWRFYLKQRP